MVYGDRPRNSPGKEEADWYNKITAEIQDRLLASGSPVYPNVGRAARAVNKIIEYYERKPA
jgi:hypothetical protein